VRYLEWLGQIARGNLGESLYNKTRVSEELVWRMPTTLALVALALVFSVAIGVPAGLMSAAFRNSWIDHAARLLTLVSLSLPSFWLGLMLIILFSLWLDLLPIVGYEPITRGFWKAVPFLILPSLSLGTYLAALLTRLTRSSMLEVLNQDFLRTARAKGIGEWSVVLRHALRNGAIPIVTAIGLELGNLLGGAVITEAVFAYPGVGRLAVEAVVNKDVPLIQAVVFTVAAALLLLNIAIDFVYTAIDPRVRLGGYRAA
jgi:peptide/nickel transport system permease protein